MVTGVTNSTGTSSTGSVAAKQTSSTQLNSDFNTFLNLMTTQAKYQDPLEPTEASDYTAQLAQFSMVEQQVLSNENLETIMTQLNLSNMSQLTGWVGKEVRAAAAAEYDGTTPIVVSPNPAAESAKVEMSVYDHTDTEVARVELPVSAEPYEWNGTDNDGEPLPAGNYTFRIESLDSEGEVLIDEMAEVYGRVAETQSIGNQVVLIMESGSTILATSVSALRDPNSQSS